MNSSQVFIKRNDLYTDSKIIAKAIGLKHSVVTRMIERIFDDYPDLRVTLCHPKKRQLHEQFIPESRVYRGNEYTVYLMNEQAFTLLLPRFKTKRAKEAYRLFNHKFYELKASMLRAEINSENMLWKELRLEGKGVRKQLTDSIKEFAIYSKLQGSKGSAHLYSNITKAINTHLELPINKAPRLRERLSLSELSSLDKLESIVGNIIHHGMESSLNYKDIKQHYTKLLSTKPRINQAAT